MEDSYNGNDEEFKQMNNQQEESIEEGENESEGEDGESQSNINLYNKEDFKLDKVMTFFFKNEILARVQYCPKCGKQMNLENNQNYMDRKVWRCRSKIMNHNTKKRRYKKIMKIAQEKSRQNLEVLIGNEYKVLIEDLTADKKYYIGRTYMDIPDTDGVIFVKNNKDGLIGQFVNSRVTKINDYDLIGEIT